MSSQKPREEDGKNLKSEPLIFIVDDSTANLKVLTTALIQRNYEIRCVKSGVMALLFLKTTLPDLILLDIKMPEMDGYEVCREIKSTPRLKDIPIIFLSALDEAWDKVRAFEVGGADYITKPFQIEEVLARIENQLTISDLKNRLNRQNRELVEQIDKQKRTEVELQKANRIKSEFLANMSHELRTPLNAILGFSQLTERDERLHPELKENLTIIRQGARELLTLIDDILDMSKIEAGRISINPESFDLHILLQTIVDIFQQEIERKELQLLLELEKDLTRYIRTDRGKLRQILLNLTGNAIKFTEEGGVSIRVKTGEIQDNRLQLQVEIEDSGVGIETEELGQLFQPFLQTKSGRASGQGTGLGLTITRKFIEMLGGEINLTSQVGKGTLVKFRVPVEIATETEIESVPLLQIPTGIVGGKEKYRILVAEDKWANRKLLVKLLQELGLETKEAENGQEVIDIWRAWRPHLIWMDMRMPVKDGYESTKYIKSQEPGEKKPIVIALTASSYEEERNRILEAGCDDFIRKPFRESEIYDKLKHHLNIEFIYPRTDNERESEKIDPEEIKALPEAWVKEVIRATEYLDITTILEKIEAIRESHPGLAGQLKILANRFQYDRIVALIEPDL